MTPGGAEDASGVRIILRRVVANAGMLLGGRTVNAVLGLGAIALAARALGAKELGVLVLIQAFAQFLGDVVEFQSWQTLLQYGTRPLAEGKKAEFQRVLRLSLVLDLSSAALGVAIGVIGAVVFADRLGWSAAQAPAASFYMVSLVFMVSATPLGLLRLFDRFDVMARQAALIALIRLIGCAVAFALDAGVEGFLLAWAIGTAGSWLYLAGSAMAELRKRDLLSGFSWRGPLAHDLPGVWRFAWNTNLAATLDVALTHLATLFIGALAGPSQAAFWRIGRQVADAIAKPAKLLTPALYPELARLRAEGRHDAMWRLSRNVGLLAGAVGVVLLALSAAFGPVLLTLVMGQAFAPAAVVMTWQVRRSDRRFRAAAGAAADFCRQARRCSRCPPRGRRQFPDRPALPRRAVRPYRRGRWTGRSHGRTCPGHVVVHPTRRRDSTRRYAPMTSPDHRLRGQV